MTSKAGTKSRQAGRAFSGRVFWSGLRIIWRHLEPHRSVLAAIAAFGLVDAAAQAFVPLVAGRIFDAIVKIGSGVSAGLEPVFWLIAVWLLLQLMSVAISWRTGFSSQKTGAILESEYIARGFGRLFQLPLSFHVSRKHGEVGDRITRAAGWMDNIVSRLSLSLLPNFLSIAVALIITLFINVVLTLVLVAAILVYAAILWRSAPRLAGLQQRMHRAYNIAFGNAYDALGNIREIKQAATERREQKKIRAAFVNRATALWLDLSSSFSRLDFSQRILVTLTQFSIFTISVFFVRSGAITPGELVAFNGYAAMILGPFVILGQNWQVLQNGLVAITRAEKIMRLPAEEYLPTGAVSPERLRGSVVFENVDFRYKGGEQVLRGVSFSARPGEKIALVGESGVGKTTMLDLLLGFYAPQGGRIVVDGTDVRLMDLTRYRSLVGVVPQEPMLFNDTVGNNIRYGSFDRSDKAVVEAAKKAHADEFIRSFPKKYKQTVGWRGIKLSIGQKQRIALARAFLKSPDILILDEPTSALDAKSEHLIKNSLRKLMGGRTTFIIAHRLSTVREVDTILVLKDGRIEEKGSHSELMKIEGGAYRRLYELQAGFSAA